MRRQIFSFLLVAATLATSVVAQNSDSTATILEADPADVESLDAITAAVYESISGPMGQERQWDRFRTLFAEGAQLIPIQKRNGVFSTVPLSVEDYIARTSGWFVQNGFFENELSRKTERYGNMAHYFSSYESLRTAEDKEPFARGINSIQAMHDGNRWWIVNIYWLGETEDNPIPSEYLPEE